MHPILARYPGLSELAAAVSTGRRSAVEIAEASLAAHHAHGDALEAYMFWAQPGALHDARAADAALKGGASAERLHGLPVSVKDCIGVEGMPTRAGSARRLPAKWEAEGPLAGTLRRQRALVVGKTCQTEFALGATGRMPYGPQPRNPWDAGGLRSAGGSSTGAALSLLEGSTVAALGTDTLGSVRIPASVAGVVGFRPGTGFWPADGIVPLSPTLDTAGVLAWSVADLIFMVEALSDAPPDVVPLSSSDMRIAMVEPCWSNCEPSVTAAVSAALNEIVAAGARAAALPLPEAEEAFRFVREGTVAVAEFNALLESELPEWRSLLQPSTAALAARGAEASAARYLADRKWHFDLANRALRCFDDFTVLAVPTLPVKPPRLDEVEDAGSQRQAHLDMLRHVCIASCLRLCAVTVPVGLDDEGIPVGLELMMPRGREAHLLSVARAVEKVLGKARERLGTPPLVSVETTLSE